MVVPSSVKSMKQNDIFRIIIRNQLANVQKQMIKKQQNKDINMIVQWT